MKKLLALSLVLTSLVFLTACDGGGDTTNNVDNLHMTDIYNIVGPTWTMVYDTVVIVETKTSGASATETIAVTHYTIVETTYTIKFNSDYTFTATANSVYTENMDRQWQNDTGLSYNYESYNVASTNETAYSGYTGKPAPGVGLATMISGVLPVPGISTETVTGVWRYTKSEMTNGDDHYYDTGIEIKVDGLSYTKIQHQGDVEAADDNVCDFFADTILGSYDTVQANEDDYTFDFTSNTNNDGYMTFDVDVMATDSGPVAIQFSAIGGTNILGGYYER